MGAAFAALGGGIMGGIQQSNALNAAQQAEERAADQYNNITPPTIAEQQLALQNQSVQGVLNPALINAQQNQIGSNAMAGIQTDPRLAQAQMNALQTLSSLGNQGLNATDLAALNQVNRGTQAQNQANQNTIMQNLAQRGASGGGLELATRLASAQNSADLANQQSQSINSQAQQRMLQAIAQSGQLGGQMQQQQFGQQATQAQAANAIAQFNAQQAAQAQATNVANQNAAQASNLNNAQNVANTNTAIQNAQQQYNKGLYQQQYNNQMGLAGSLANSQLGLGAFEGQQANAIGQQWNNIGQGTAKAIAGYQTANQNNQTTQSDQPDITSSDM